jgi:hypothetical protein
LGGNGCTNIHPVKEAATHEVSKGVGIVGKHNFIHHCETVLWKSAMILHELDTKIKTGTGPVLEYSV